MKRILTIILVFSLSFTAAAQYPSVPDSVGMAFARAYESGDKSAFDYVLFEGYHVNDMGGTVEELRDELLPKELKENAKNPVTPVYLESKTETDNPVYKHPVRLVVYSARGKKHTLCMHEVSAGLWKTDISYLWMGDWYDWMPGY